MIIGLDIGTKRTGVALSSGLLAAEYGCLVATGEALITKIKEICQKERAEKLVIGLPLNSDGSPSQQTEYVIHIVEQLKAALGLPIILEDEFLTTAEAYRLMEEVGISRQQAEERIDQYSAKLILQQYLDQNDSQVLE